MPFNFARAAAGMSLLTLGIPCAGAPIVRVLEIASYNARAFGNFVPVAFCDGFGCDPNPFGAVFISGPPVFGSNVTSDEMDLSGGFSDDGNTDGNLKETSLNGTFGIDMGGLEVVGETTELRLEAYVNALLFIGGDLYSCFVIADASVDTRIRVRGLPNERFVYTLSGPGLFVPAEDYSRPGAFIGPGLLAVGDYKFSVATPFMGYDYLCPACPRVVPRDGEAPTEAANERGLIGVGLNNNAVSTIALTRDESTHRWLAQDGGIGGPTLALLARRDNQIIAGGQFIFAGGDPASRIAKWDGQSWSALGSGLNGSVRALAEFNGGVVAGGDFTIAGGLVAKNVAFWDGEEWSPIGPGLNRTVHALTVHEGVLYAGGEFFPTAAQPFGSLARWAPSSDSWVGVASVDGPVLALESVETASSRFLVLGGDFSAVDGSPSSNFAVLVGDPKNGYSSLWVNGGVDGPVYALAGSAGAAATGDARTLVYVGGDFSAMNFGLFEASRAAVFDISSATWNRMAGGVDGAVSLILVHDPGPDETVVVAGDFTSADGQPVAWLARWDGDRWSALGPQFNNSVKAITMFRDEVVAAGTFTEVGGQSAPAIARWTLDIPASPCPGDADGDLFVGFQDLNIVLAAFNTFGSPNFHPGDVNSDGAVGFADLNIVVASFNVLCEP